MANKIVFPKDVMKNRHGMDPDVFESITKRDSKCIYCKRGFILWQPSKPHRGRAPSVEHIINRNIEWWKLKAEECGICCRSCNSSRGQKHLKRWFESSYCTDRKVRISKNTVAFPVKKFLRKYIKTNKNE